ncbi:DUF4179 domain-containing protein [Cohnella faecalis]|uniref:DUF4179 domain-containing protein n=1 Tax=Cohnella faecalis TaxID=2315694 RepID=A0A398CPY9_9BACL|nr:DUF4179 domain-containing protein [Cohnella faecalis]RIE01897.1 DUF4179 domain-containing protein [Cohnella faecalis]
MTDGARTERFGFDEDKAVYDVERLERFDEAVRAGMARGRIERNRSRMRIRRRVALTAAVGALLLACLFSLRVSPVFAAMVSRIPGLETFVDLVRVWSGDRSVELAMDNDMIQPVGITDERDGIRFTVEGIVADERRLVVFYSIYGMKDPKSAYPEFPSVTTIDGGELQAMIGWTNPFDDMRLQKKSDVQRGTLDIRLLSGLQMPEEVVMKLKLPAEQGDLPFQVIIPIDRAKFAGMTKEYPLNRTVVAEGQTITFVKAVVRPLQTEIHIEYDEKNAKQVFDAGDIKLVDDKGEQWRFTSGGGGVGENRDIVYFESNYFRKPKELYVEGSWFRALDKNNREIVIDTERGVLLKAPDDQLRLEVSKQANGDAQLKLMLNLPLEDHMGYTLLDQSFKDATDKEFRLSDSSGTKTALSPGEDRNEQTGYYYVTKNSYAQPLVFRVPSYPQYIREPYKIRIR